METAGATKIFSTSKEKHGPYCSSYYGDESSKAYPSVQDIYGSTKTIKKFGCVGHYQKTCQFEFHNLEKTPKDWEQKENQLVLKLKDKLETRAGMAVLRTYVENQGILEPILLYRASK